MTPSRRSRRASATCSPSSPLDTPTPRSPAELTLSEATVKTHVAHILDKLDLRDRVQAVIFAYERRVNRAG